jgi:hypothetical protein
MAPPAEVAVEPEAEVELWAQSAAGKMTIDTTRGTIRKKNARWHRNWRVGRFAEVMELGFSPYETKMIRLLDSFWWRSDANC